VGAAVTAWTCAWVLTEQRERQGEEAPVLRQTVALPLPSSPTMAAPYKGSSISRTCLHPPLRSNPSDFTGSPAFVKLAKRTRACRAFAASARKRLSRQDYCARCISLSHCISLRFQRAIPQSRGSSPPVRYLSSSPSNGGVTPLFPAAMLFIHWETIENFGAVTYGVQAICRAGI
jgi:hypothetical protein